MNITENERELISAFDYQIFNNGITDMYYNHYYREMFNYFDILSKDGSDISIEASTLLKRAFILIIDLDRYGEFTDPEFGLSRQISEWKRELKNIEDRYCSISDNLLKQFTISKVKGSIKPSYDY